MTNDDKTRYIAIKGTETRDVTLASALSALALDEADFILVMRTNVHGLVNCVKWTLVETGIQ